jgi:hypothetical protein
MIGQSSFAESVLGRITLVVLFTTVVSLVFFMLFLVNQSLAPDVLKYALLIALGIAAGFNARRIFFERSFVFRFACALFALFIALGVLNVFSRGFIGLNLLRAYPSVTQWDGPISFALAGLFAFLSLRAWRGSAREIVVEPRSAAPVVVGPEPAPRRTRARAARPVPGSLAASFAALRQSVSSGLSRLTPAAPAGRTSAKRKAKKPTKRKLRNVRPARRSVGVLLSGEEEHVCPYCLEEVVKNDRRGVKVCKVCKTWHHGDCWAITGVCQVPHQYVN